MEIIYKPSSINVTPADGATPAQYQWAYTRQIVNEGEVLASSEPHRGTFADTEAARAAEYPIHPDGQQRTGEQILIEFGLAAALI